MTFKFSHPMKAFNPSLTLFLKSIRNFSSSEQKQLKSQAALKGEVFHFSIHLKK